MKKFQFLLFITFLQFFSAQIKDPVKLQYSVNDLGNNQYEAVITATIAQGFHINSKDNSPDTVIPTEMKVICKEGIDLVGGVTEVGKLHKEFSDAFGGEVANYSDLVLFKQKFKLKNPAKSANITTEITYQTCNDKVCFAPKTLEFDKTLTSKNTSATTETVTTTEQITEPKKDTQKVSVNSQNIPISTVPTEIKTVQYNNKDLKISSINLEMPLTDCGVAKENKTISYWMYLFLGLIGGLIALLTPCVFPMIPLTVSFFTKGTKNKSNGKRDALLYGVFILLIFIALSIPFHIINGIAGNIFNQIATSIWLNLFFFVIFIFFAISFFGYYDITLPSSIANKSSKAEDAGGIIGIFFMALTLVIVSFSCTGPILGSLLGSAVTGSSNIPMLLTFALAGFGFAWAIVFGLLALFPQALHSLPKSGGWMNTVKVVLGFIELGLALKFLSKADLVSKTMYLKRELFIIIWVIITIALVLYFIWNS